jgi:hypothetical protein
VSSIQSFLSPSLGGNTLYQNHPTSLERIRHDPFCIIIKPDSADPRFISEFKKILHNCIDDDLSNKKIPLNVSEIIHNSIDAVLENPIEFTEQDVIRTVFLLILFIDFVSRRQLYANAKTEFLSSLQDGLGENTELDAKHQAKFNELSPVTLSKMESYFKAHTFSNQLKEDELAFLVPLIMRLIFLKQQYKSMNRHMLQLIGDFQPETPSALHWRTSDDGKAALIHFPKQEEFLLPFNPPELNDIIREKVEASLSFLPPGQNKDALNSLKWFLALRYQGEVDYNSKNIYIDKTKLDFLISNLNSIYSRFASAAKLSLFHVSEKVTHQILYNCKWEQMSIGEIHGTFIILWKFVALFDNIEYKTNNIIRESFPIRLDYWFNIVREFHGGELTLYKFEDQYLFPMYWATRLCFQALPFTLTKASSLKQFSIPLSHRMIGLKNDLSYPSEGNRVDEAIVDFWLSACYPRLAPWGLLRWNSHSSLIALIAEKYLTYPKEIFRDSSYTFMLRTMVYFFSDRQKEFMEYLYHDLPEACPASSTPMDCSISSHQSIENPTGATQTIVIDDESTDADCLAPGEPSNPMGHLQSAAISSEVSLEAPSNERDEAFSEPDLQSFLASFGTPSLEGMPSTDPSNEISHISETVAKKRKRSRRKTHVTVGEPMAWPIKLQEILAFTDAIAADQVHQALALQKNFRMKKLPFLVINKPESEKMKVFAALLIEKVVDHRAVSALIVTSGNHRIQAQDEIHFQLQKAQFSAVLTVLLNWSQVRQSEKEEVALKIANFICSLSRSPEITPRKSDRIDMISVLIKKLITLKSEFKRRFAAIKHSKLSDEELSKHISRFYEDTTRMETDFDKLKQILQFLPHQCVTVLSYEEAGKMSNHPYDWVLCDYDLSNPESGNWIQSILHTDNMVAAGVNGLQDLLNILEITFPDIIPSEIKKKILKIYEISKKSFAKDKPRTLTWCYLQLYIVAAVTQKMTLWELKRDLLKENPWHQFLFSRPISLKYSLTDLKDHLTAFIDLLITGTGEPDKQLIQNKLLQFMDRHAESIEKKYKELIPLE